MRRIQEPAAGTLTVRCTSESERSEVSGRCRPKAGSWPGPGAWQQGALRNVAVAVGNRMAVRVLVRMPDEPIDRVEHARADVMLEHLGVCVHLGPVEPEHPHQERLEDAVAPNHFEGTPAP